MRYAGIDPGQTGACCIVAADGLTVLATQRWNDRKIPPLIAILRPGDVLALEAQHVDGPHASLVLAEWCGRLLSTLNPTLRITRPLATTWRAKLFRNGRMRRDVAKKFAIAAATPYLLPFLTEHGGDCTISHDLAESWCLARYAAFWGPAHPEVTVG